MEQAGSMATDVLIVGLGPVGAALANLLGRYGVRTLVVDAAADIFTAPRAIALDNEALRILQLAGLPERAFETVAIPHVAMRSPFFGEFGRMNTLGQIDGHPKLVTFFQPALERALRDHLARHPSVQVRTGLEFLSFTETATGIEARLGGGVRVGARYLIGADGANSAVRRQIGQDFTGRTYAEDWLIVDALDVPRPIDHVEFICDHRRPTPHMVAPGGRERWEFMLHRHEKREEMERDERIASLLAPWCGPGEARIERRAVYRFHARVVDSFRKGRVFLAGDAAHITPPFAGQGLVAGLRDAANLAWKLAWVLQGRADERILESYDSERRPHARAMIDFARFIGRLVMPTSALKAFVLHGIMRSLRAVPPLRRRFEDNGLKPVNRFVRGLFKPGRSRLPRGGLLPQALLRSMAGEIRLSDDVLGPRLSLIGFGVDPATRLTPAELHLLAAAGGEVVQVSHRGQRGDGDAWEDVTGTFLPALPLGWVALVRPDRTILHDGPAARVAQMLEEGLALLGVSALAPVAITAIAS